MATEFDQIGWSIAFSLLSIFIYLALCGVRRKVPGLTHAVMIAMSCSGFFAAVLLGVTAYGVPPEELGVLKEQKAGILLGALAMGWASVVSACTSVVSPLVSPAASVE